MHNHATRHRMYYQRIVSHMAIILLYQSMVIPQLRLYVLFIAPALKMMHTYTNFTKTYFMMILYGCQLACCWYQFYVQRGMKSPILFQGLYINCLSIIYCPLKNISKHSNQVKLIYPLIRLIGRLKTLACDLANCLDAFA